MIDESMDISIKGHLFLLAIFLEGDLSLTRFLGLLFIIVEIEDFKVIFDILMATEKSWGRICLHE